MLVQQILTDTRGRAYDEGGRIFGVLYGCNAIIEEGRSLQAIYTLGSSDTNEFVPGTTKRNLTLTVKTMVVFDKTDVEKVLNRYLTVKSDGWVIMDWYITMHDEVEIADSGDEIIQNLHGYFYAYKKDV